MLNDFKADYSVKLSELIRQVVVGRALRESDSWVGFSRHANTCYGGVNGRNRKP